MKKLVRVLVILAVVLTSTFAFAGTVLADDPPDPTVNISGSTDRLDNSVNGNFSSGTVNWQLDATTGTHVVNTSFTNIAGGSFQINTAGKDTTAWHPGVVGQTNNFQAGGTFTATYTSQTNGNYGILGSYVNANSGAGGAWFQMNDTQDFNIMSGNHNYNVVGNFLAIAAGGDNQVAMNLKSIGSMYVYSEATNPYWQPGLQGNFILKEVWSQKNGVLTTDLFMSVSTDGIATISNSNIWGFGNRESGTLSTTNYNGGTRTVSATGNGQYNQTGFGANELNFNGFNFPGGASASILANFVGGFSGTYTMDAK